MSESVYYGSVARSSPDPSYSSNSGALTGGLILLLFAAAAVYGLWEGYQRNKDPYSDYANREFKRGKCLAKEREQERKRAKRLAEKQALKSSKPTTGKSGFVTRAVLFFDDVRYSISSKAKR